MSVFIGNAAEDCFDFPVIAMVAHQGDALAADVFHIFGRSSRDIDRSAGIGELNRDAFPDSTTGAGYEGNLPWYFLHGFSFNHSAATTADCWTACLTSLGQP